MIYRHEIDDVILEVFDYEKTGGSLDSTHYN